MKESWNLDAGQNKPSLSGNHTQIKQKISGMNICECVDKEKTASTEVASNFYSKSIARTKRDFVSVLVAKHKHKDEADVRFFF